MNLKGMTKGNDLNNKLKIMHSFL